MAKRKRKFHKIIIHPNRYLMWAVAVMIMVALSLWAYIYVTQINLDAQQQSELQFWHTYKDANFTMRYPAAWLIDAGSGYIGFGPKNADRFLVYSYSPPNDPAYDSYSKLPNVRHITIDGLDAIRVPDAAKQDQKIAFVKTSKRLYEFRGDAKEFDQILGTVHFIKK